MTPDELKRLDARCRIARRDAVINGNDLPETMVWDSITKTHRELTCNMHTLDEGSYYALADDVKLTPKIVELEGFYVDAPNGNKVFQSQINHELSIIQELNWKHAKAIITIQDTSKEHKEQRDQTEYTAWVRGGNMVEVSDWEIVMGGLDPVKVGYRLATLVEKGGGE